MTQQARTDEEEGESKEIASPLREALARPHSLECSAALEVMDQPSAVPAATGADRSDILQVL